MTDLFPSNFERIEKTFSDMIIHIRDTDRSGTPSTARIRKKAYTLLDKSKLYITEYVDKSYGKLEKYYYEWVDMNGRDLMRFHSETHERKEDQTVTEPYHIHTEEGLNQFKKRLPNFNNRTLFEIFESIRIVFIYNKLV